VSDGISYNEFHTRNNTDLYDCPKFLHVKIRYQLKTPFRDGTTHILFEPLDFVARLAALVPKPRVNLTRFFGIFAPNSKNRSELTPRKTKQHKAVALTGQTEKAKRKAMTRAQRLKRFFGIDIETCQQCGGVVKVLASIKNPVVIAKILSHLTQKYTKTDREHLPENRASPQYKLFD